MAKSACPTPQELDRVLRGPVNRHDLDRLVAHLEGCETCASYVESLLNDGNFKAQLEAQSGTSATAAEPVIAKVLARLRSRRRGSSAHNTVGEADGTAATVPPGDRGSSSLGFLDTPRSADELGWLAHYRVLRQLGAGGMGLVFLAEDTLLARQVALKVMQPSLANESGNRERFLREARAAAALTHDHVVTIYQVGEHNGAPYLAMQLLQGESLDDYLKRGKKLAPIQICKVGREVAEGLAAAHERGLIHRDIKPANLWLEAPKGRVKILDFGLARSSNDVNLTGSGFVLGTPSYMSPEQARAAADLDGRADLWSLGVTLYMLASGKMPFQGADIVAIVTAIALDEPTPLERHNPYLPQEFVALVTQLVAKDKTNRPKDAKEVSVRLLQIERQLRAAQAATTATGVGPPTSSSRTLDATLVQQGTDVAQTKSRRGLIIAAGVALVATALAAGVWVANKPVDQPVTLASLPNPTPPDLPPVTWKSRDPVRNFDVPKGPAAPVPLVAFTSDGQTLVTFDSIRVARRPATGGVWTTQPVDVELARAGLKGPPQHAALSPNGKFVALALAGPTPKVVLWDIPNHRLARDKENDASAAITGLAFRPDGGAVSAAAGPGHDMFIIRDGAIVERRTYRDEADEATGIAYGAGGSWITTALRSGAVRVRDREANQLKWENTAARPPQFALAWTPDGKRLATAGMRSGVLFNANGQKLADLPIRFRGLAASPDSKLFAAVADVEPGIPGSLVLLDAETGRVVVRSGPDLDHEVPALAFSPDGRTVVSLDRSSVLKFWDVPKEFVTAVPIAPVIAPTVAPVAAAPTFDDWLKTTKALPADKRADAVLAKMKELNSGFEGWSKPPEVRQGVVAKLTFKSNRVADLTPLMALSGLSDLTCHCPEIPRTGAVMDLTPLRALRDSLRTLDLHGNTKLTDLGPLEGMQIRDLNLGFTAVRDLTPLVGLPLQSLRLGWTPAIDFGPIAKTPLKYLDIRGNSNRRLATLGSAAKLEAIEIAWEPAKLAPLRAIKSLKTIDSKPAAEVLR
ncbi:MAG: protein kinase [Gemmataceae bacterium]